MCYIWQILSLNFSYTIVHQL